MENENVNQNTETKQNWFKTHSTICIVCAVVVVVAIAAILIFMTGKSGTPQQVVETYVEAMKTGDVDKLMSVTDVKGAYAWEECDGDASKFEEEYNKVSDEDAKSYEETTRSGLESAMGMLKTFGSSIEMTINSIEEPEELAKDLYRVDASVKMKVSIFGMDQEEDQDLSLVTYKGKYVGEMR